MLRYAKISFDVLRKAANNSVAKYSSEAAATQPKRSSKKLIYSAIALSSAGAFAYYYYLREKRCPKPRRYSLQEIAKHDKSDSIWITYNGKVYDVTNYAKSHPGGEELILKVAGKSIDSDWEEYRFHKTQAIEALLETMKIGVVREKAENPRCKSAKTIPKINPDDYKLELKLGDEVAKSLKFEELKKYPKHSIVSTIPCKNDSKKEADEKAGRTWTGAKLSDVLREFDIKESTYSRLEFVCLDGGKVNLQMAQILDPKFDVLLAYEMNDADVPPEQGYPIRVVMPSLGGSRNVKWLAGIVLVKRGISEI